MTRRGSLLFQIHTNHNNVDNLNPLNHTVSGSAAAYNTQGGEGDTMNAHTDNAFASAVKEQQYDVMEDDARRALSQAIETHASTIKYGKTGLEIEDLDELEGGGEMAPVSSGPVSEPPPKSIAATFLGSRFFSQGSSKKDDHPDDNNHNNNTFGQGGGRPSLNRDASIRSQNSRSSQRSSMSLSGGSPVDTYTFVYPYETRKAMLHRLAIAVGCFLFSLLLSFLIGNGNIGQQMASYYYFTSIKQSP